ncbi:MAG: hypothetical protein CMH53_04575 [Myxococcales bacterium]|jgi:hypothetical protein|nr:hypothetical protein [Myxococcales bacterium]
MITTTNVQANIADFVERLNDKFPERRYGVMVGKKNARIFWQNVYNGQVREGASAFCFVRLEDGAILKCDSWKAPAKGVRAWLDQVLANDLQEVDQYTGWLYR